MVDSNAIGVGLGTKPVNEKKITLELQKPTFFEKVLPFFDYREDGRLAGDSLFIANAQNYAKRLKKENKMINVE